MKKSNYVSPAYNIMRVDIDDIVSQKANPNSQTKKDFYALQRSILNSGYTDVVKVAPNKEYDPSTAGQPRPSLIENSDGEETHTGALKLGTQVSDDEVAKYFPYRLIDGSHRSQIIRLGKYYFENGYEYVEDMLKRGEQPQKPGPEMLAFIARREQFTIPAAYLDIDENAQMSSEVLHNTARGSHGLDSTKELIERLVKSGKSEEWISENLNVDIESIKRMQKTSGLRREFESLDEVEPAWLASEDNAYERKLTSYLNREATSFIHMWKQQHPDQTIQQSGSSVEIAESLGFDAEKARKDFENRNKK